MRRLAVPVSVLAVALICMVALGRSGAGAQDNRPDAEAGDPLVGAWAGRADANHVGPPGLMVFTADGIVVDSSTGGTNGFGSWAASGSRTVRR